MQINGQNQSSKNPSLTGIFCYNMLMNKPPRVALATVTIVIESIIISHSYGWSIFSLVLYGVLPGAILANIFIGYYLRKWRNPTQKKDILVILYPILLLILGEIMLLRQMMHSSNGQIYFEIGMDSYRSADFPTALAVSSPFSIITTVILYIPFIIGYIISKKSAKKKENNP